MQAKPYPHLVIGRLLQVADESQTRKLYRQAKSKGYWAGLPDDEQAFVERLQPILLETPVGAEIKTLTLLMAVRDYRASGIQTGGLVRFMPHPPKEQTKPGYTYNPEDPYWVAHGCLTLLCGEGDERCLGHYQPGIYQPNGQLLPEPGISPPVPIDPVTYFPMSPPSQLQPGMQPGGIEGLKPSKE